MKKSFMLLAIFGWFLIGANLLGGAMMVESLTKLPLVNVAFYVDMILHVALGAFFVWTYYKVKQAEEPGGALQKDQPQRLRLLRNWIISFIIFFEFAGSVSSWVLNDYFAGFTVLNISSIFDLLANIVLVYFAVEFLRGKNKLNQFFWTILIYGVVGAILMLLRQHWYGAFGSLAFAGYFIYAIKAPLTSKQFRIAHLVILPLLIICMFASGSFDNGRIPELAKQYDLLEQQLSDATADVNGSYINFSKNPNSIDLQNMQQGLEKYNQRTNMLVTNIQELQAEYRKQIPSFSQQKTIEKLRFNLLFLDIYHEQSAKMQELIDYSKNLNLKNLTKAQLESLNTLEQSINSESDKLTELQFELKNANVE
jgi:hypothetical protein